MYAREERRGELSRAGTRFLFVDRIHVARKETRKNQQTNKQTNRKKERKVRSSWPIVNHRIASRVPFRVWRWNSWKQFFRVSCSRAFDSWRLIVRPIKPSARIKDTFRPSRVNYRCRGIEKFRGKAAGHINPPWHVAPALIARSLKPTTPFFFCIKHFHRSERFIATIASSLVSCFTLLSRNFAWFDGASVWSLKNIIVQSE